jgi:hypothetical protein
LAERWQARSFLHWLVGWGVSTADTSPALLRKGADSVAYECAANRPEWANMAGALMLCASGSALTVQPAASTGGLDPT